METPNNLFPKNNVGLMFITAWFQHRGELSIKYEKEWDVLCRNAPFQQAEDKMLDLFWAMTLIPDYTFNPNVIENAVIEVRNAIYNLFPRQKDKGSWSISDYFYHEFDDGIVYEYLTHG